MRNYRIGYVMSGPLGVEHHDDNLGRKYWGKRWPLKLVRHLNTPTHTDEVLEEFLDKYGLSAPTVTWYVYDARTGQVVQ